MKFIMRVAVALLVTLSLGQAHSADLLIRLDDQAINLDFVAEVQKKSKVCEKRPWNCR